MSESTTALSAPDANGATDPSDDEQIIVAIEQKRAALEVRRDELQAELDTITPDLRRYEKAIAAIKGQPLGNPSRRRDPDDDQATPRQVLRTKAARGVSDERLAQVEAVIREIAAEQDDFTQVAVRDRTGLQSSTMALAFEVLRARNVIRFVRKDGNAKMFRLTREALRDNG